MAMKYELTKDLETGNALIDSEHRQLFAAINNLMDACAQGKGRDQIMSTARFLTDYVGKHFGDEEQLQMRSKYPDYPAHKQFHDGYKCTIAQAAQELANEGPTLTALNKLNQVVSILITHIRREDKKVAAHVKAAK